MFGEKLIESNIIDLNKYLLHLDLDYFFAAVEIRKNPDLKGKKLIVGNKNARITKRGVVLTCSYEAREFGVHSGMSMLEALKRCPDAVIANEARSEYKLTSKRIMKYLKRLNLPISISSIDEAYIDISDIVSSFQETYYLAKAIKQQIFKQEGLTCSIGIGPTLKIAKIASDYNKPDGITIVPPSKVHNFFNNLPLKKIPGIGKKTSNRLKLKGYEYCHQLIKKSEGELMDLFGEWGRYLWKIFNARSTNSINHRVNRKSISHERTFHGKPLDFETYNSFLIKLFDKTFQQMKKENFMVKTLGVKIRYNGFDTITRVCSLTSPSNDPIVLFQKLNHITEKYFKDPRGLRLLGVKFSNLIKEPKDAIKLDSFFN